jgi:hypothetical protein
MIKRESKNKVFREVNSRTASNLNRLVTIDGPLAVIYPLFKPESLRQADEISIERHINNYLRSKHGWTANVATYRIEDGEVILYLGQRDVFNLTIGDNITNATSQLMNRGRFTPSEEQVDVEAIVKNSLRIKITDLELKGEEEYGYFEIDTSDEKGENLNEYQKIFAARAYGSLEEKTDRETGERYNEFGRTMKTVREFQHTITPTRVYALKPEFVDKKIYEKEKVFMMACWLHDFIEGSSFFANVRRVDFGNGSLRGNPLERYT